MADLFRGTAGRALVVGLCLMVFQQFSGINAVIFYTSDVSVYGVGDLVSCVF